jgi:hypothetical protein
MLKSAQGPSASNPQSRCSKDPRRHPTSPPASSHSSAVHWGSGVEHGLVQSKAGLSSEAAHSAPSSSNAAQSMVSATPVGQLIAYPPSQVTLTLGEHEAASPLCGTQASHVGLFFGNPPHRCAPLLAQSSPWSDEFGHQIRLVDAPPGQLSDAQPVAPPLPAHTAAFPSIEHVCPKRAQSSAYETHAGWPSPESAPPSKVYCCEHSNRTSPVGPPSGDPRQELPISEHDGVPSGNMHALTSPQL